MSARLSIAFFYMFSALTLLAAATPAPWAIPPPATTIALPPTPTAPVSPNQCNTGPVQCCTSTSTATDANAATLLGLLGIIISGLDVIVGMGCSPISVIGVGGGACSAKAVCCEDNSHGNLISIGCIPVTL
ncbi:hypothetical protein QCA50_015191 [Cerrena zonata]|uniref:Hydrophobin n=1 Tax=Cerrena zonata TaxID=2478898 RepID=A0AAW0FS10_9APHY